MGNRLGPNAEPNPNDPNPEVAWWCKLLSRAVATVGGAICAVLGIWTCLSVTPICIAAGILQIAVGVLVVMAESPCCCQFIDITKPIGDFAEKRTFLQKAIIYGVLAIFPLAMCFGLAALFGCGLVFAGAVLYGLMALGKKADRGEMLNRAAPTSSRSIVGQGEDVKVTLIDNDGEGQLAPSTMPPTR